MAWWLRPWSLVSNYLYIYYSSALWQLCDLGEIVQPLCASFPHLYNEDKNTYHPEFQ
jgi:hypothetical protein